MFQKYYLGLLKSNLCHVYLPGRIPYCWNNQTNTISIKRNTFYCVSYKLTLIVHVIYCAAMAIKMSTGQFHLFEFVVGTGFTVAYIAFLAGRWNWTICDKYIFCINCFIQLESRFNKTCKFNVISCFCLFVILLVLINVMLIFQGNVLKYRVRRNL